MLRRLRNWFLAQKLGAFSSAKWEVPAPGTALPVNPRHGAPIESVSSLCQEAALVCRDSMAFVTWHPKCIDASPCCTLSCKTSRSAMLALEMRISTGEKRQVTTQLKSACLLIVKPTKSSTKKHVFAKWRKFQTIYHHIIAALHSELDFGIISPLLHMPEPHDYAVSFSRSSNEWSEIWIHNAWL